MVVAVTDRGKVTTCHLISEIFVHHGSREQQHGEEQQAGGHGHTKLCLEGLLGVRSLRERERGVRKVCVCVSGVREG